ncbi:MAG: hypothetical protein ACYDCK_13420 [Thermoplasmatota archaeon]
MATTTRTVAFVLLLVACAALLGVVALVLPRSFARVEFVVSLTALLAMLDAWVAGRVLERRAGRYPALAAALSLAWLAGLVVFAFVLEPAADLGGVGWSTACIAALATVAPAFMLRAASAAA